MSKARSYNLSVPVDWSSITSFFYWRLGVLVRDAEHWIKESHIAINHYFPDEYFIAYEYQAALACEKVFSFVDLFSSLRSFLRQAPLNESVRGVTSLRNWYSERSEEAYSYGEVSLPIKSPFSSEF